jgi:MGT family glycosyltransferase
MKKRFLFVMIEGGGNVPAQLSVARRLAARGHDVHVLGDGAIEKEAALAGASFHPFVRAPHQNMRDREKDLVKDWEPKTPMGQFARVADRLFFGPAEAYARDVLEHVERLHPDAIGVDVLSIGAMAGAEKSGVPTAAMFHMPYMVPLEGVTPLGMGFQPAAGPLSRLRDRVFRWLLFRTFDAGLDRLNATRDAIGLGPLANVFDQFLAFPRTLVLASASFDFVPTSPPAGVRWVGAQLDDPGWAQPWSSPWPTDAKDPLVLASLGSTYQKQEPTFRRLVDALAKLPVRAVVTTGGQLDPSSLPAHPNVAVVSSAPHSSVLPHASLVVCHGGHGTVMKSLAHGLPVVCIPFGRDQKDNGARLVRGNAGVVVSPRASAARLARTISSALADGRLRTGAARLKRAIAEDTKRDLAVSELEELAGAQLIARAS